MGSIAHCVALRLDHFVGGISDFVKFWGLALKKNSTMMELPVRNRIRLLWMATWAHDAVVFEQFLAPS